MYYLEMTKCLVMQKSIKRRLITVPTVTLAVMKTSKLRIIPGMTMMMVWKMYFVEVRARRITTSIKEWWRRSVDLRMRLMKLNK